MGALRGPPPGDWHVRHHPLGRPRLRYHRQQRQRDRRLAGAGQRLRSVPDGWKNTGASVLTITPTTSTINRKPALSLAQNWGANRGCGLTEHAHASDVGWRYLPTPAGCKLIVDEFA